MEQNVKKDILNLAGDIHLLFKQKLEEGGFAFVDSCTDKTAFIFVRNSVDWESFEEKYKVLENDIHLVSLSPVENKAEFWKYNGRAILDEKSFDDDLLAKVIQRFFFVDSAVHLDYAYDQLLKESHHFKLMSHLSLGYYLDPVAKLAFELDFNVIHLRSFYVDALSYITYLQKAGIVQYPIDVQYGYSDSSFVFQCVVNARGIYSEYLTQAMEEDDGKNPVKSLLKSCEKSCDFFDVYQLKSSEKLVLSGLWLKEKKTSFTSFFTNNIASFYGERRRLMLQSPFQNYDIEGGSNSALQALDYKALPGEGVQPGAPGLMNHPEVLSDLIQHLVQKKGVQGNEEESAFTLENLDHYLKDYEKVEALSDLNELDKKIIISALKEVEENKILGVDQVLEHLEKVDFYDDEVKETTLVKGDAFEKESSQIVKGGPTEKEEVTVVRGSQSAESDKNHVTIIRGSGNSSAKGIFNLAKVLPSTVASKVDKDKWRVVRGELIKELSTMRSEGKNFEEIESAFIEKVTSEFGIFREEAKVFVQGILGPMNAQASSVEATKKLIEAKEKLNKEKAQVEVVKKESARHYGEEVKKRDQQILKMKRIIDVMKKELDNTKKSLAYVKSKELEGRTENLKDENAKIAEDKMLLTGERHSLEVTVKSLETELQLKNKELAKRESQIQNLKDAQQKLNERHEAIVKEYQNRIQELNSAQAHSLSAQELEELGKLRQENITMSSMLELSNKKITNLSETYERLKKHGDDKVSSQIKNLTESKLELTTQLRQSQDREMKAEGRCRSLEASVEKLQMELDRLRESQVVSEGSSDQEKVIRELKAEELNQRQQLKQSELNNKKLEQKIKFLTEQLAQAQKATVTAHKGNGAGESNKASDAKVKQLEMNLEKLNIASSKMKDELAEKKKENLKLKTDLQTLQNQLQEAHRKMGVLEKKKVA